MAGRLEKKSDAVHCLYCSHLLRNDVKKMSPLILAGHISCCHLEKKPQPEYECNGNSATVDEEDGLSYCSQIFKTPIVNDFVDHMSISHPDEKAPIQAKYKAAISELMSEICTFRNTRSSMADEERCSALTTEYNRVCDSLIPNINQNRES